MFFYVSEIAVAITFFFIEERVRETFQPFFWPLKTKKILLFTVRAPS